MSKISELSDGGSLSSTDYLIAVRSGGNVKVRMDTINVDQITLGDNEMIRLGNSQDLTMVHTSTQSIINQAGIGDLLLQKAGATKLTINASGIDVAGSVTADGLTVSGSLAAGAVLATISNSGANGAAQLYLNNDAQSWIVNTRVDDAFSVYNATSDKTPFLIATSGNVGIGVVPKTGGSTWQHVQFGGTGNLIARKDDSIVDAMFSNNYYVNASNADSYITTGAAARMFINDNVISFDQAASGSTDAAITWSEALRIDSSGTLLAGKTATAFGTAGVEASASNGLWSTRSELPALALNRLSTDGSIADFYKDGTTVGSIGNNVNNLTVNGLNAVELRQGGTTRAYVYSSGLHPWADATYSLGIAGSKWSDLYLSGGVQNVTASGVETGTIISAISGVTNGFQISANTSNQMTYDFNTGSGLKMRLTNDGNLLVGKSEASFATAGVAVFGSGEIDITNTNEAPLYLNRLGSDGVIQYFYKDGTNVGSIGAINDSLYIASPYSTDSGLRFSASIVHPCTTTGAPRDNAIDLGYSAGRFDDIYATNGTIQTSDRNEKQDIAELSDAEQRVAVAAKGLLRKFRWKDSVAEKGDEARTHFGIIAQDLQAAFAAEGLDAGVYAMFINSTWTDEETGEERSRMGVRYSELLAFIIAAI